MTRIRRTVLVLGMSLCLAVQATNAQQRPNILFIMADDLGYGDLGCYGSELPTPHLDALARQGIKLTQIYAAASTCTPSRFGLLTGKHPLRSKDNLLNPLAYGDPADADRGIRPGEKTIAAYLTEAGYYTALIGKWHLGHGQKAFLPTRHGFQTFWGYTGGAIDFFTSRYGAEPDLHVGEEIVEKPGYVTDLTSDEAVHFLTSRPKNQPFFLCLHYNAPHFGKPWDDTRKAAVNILQGKPEYIIRFREIKDSTRREYAAMMKSLDEGVGRVLNALKTAGLEEETLVIFTSDNGGSLNHGGRNRPLRGQKTTLFEGGIRVPCLIRWKGRLPEGKQNDTPLSMLDWFPTWLRLAGVASDAAAPDGMDVWPVLADGKKMPVRPLFWSEVAAPRDGGRPTNAIRVGRWKWIQTPDGKQLLFDLGRDESEQLDVADRHPGMRAELMKRFIVWRETALNTPASEK